MITTIIILGVVISVMKFIKLYRKQPETYDQLLRKGLVLELFLMKKQAIISYENGLSYLPLSTEERSNIHYLIGIIMQEQNQAKDATEHFNEAFREVPSHLAFRKEYQKVLDAYKNVSDDKKKWISCIFKMQSEHDNRFEKLKYP